MSLEALEKFDEEGSVPPPNPFVCILASSFLDNELIVEVPEIATMMVKRTDLFETIVMEL